MFRNIAAPNLSNHGLEIKAKNDCTECGKGVYLAICPPCMQVQLHGSCHILQAPIQAARGEQASQRSKHGRVLRQEPLCRQPKHPLCERLDCWPASTQTIILRKSLHASALKSERAADEHKSKLRRNRHEGGLLSLKNGPPEGDEVVWR